MPVDPQAVGEFWAICGLPADRAMAWVDRYLPQDIADEVINADEETRLRVALVDG
ncbi:MAG: hypothetical protein KF861_02065 [Planctomycetaceae bacterium]|nr:hypothetical protein [Planctomycetaceae bacterium]